MRGGLDVKRFGKLWTQVVMNGTTPTVLPTVRMADNRFHGVLWNYDSCWNTTRMPVQRGGSGSWAPAPGGDAGTEIRWHLSDHKRVLRNEVGNSISVSTSEFGFSFWNQGCGLRYVEQRYFAGTLGGRFLSADPYEASGVPSNPGTWGKYAYVGGDPVNSTDKNGLFTSSGVCGAEGTQYCISDGFIAGGFDNPLPIWMWGDCNEN